MTKGRKSYSLLYGYIGRSFMLSFLASFLFFFFIFFVNQILVLAKEILLKNVSVKIVLYLVVLTIPQFLLFTFPFSSLSAASITIGNLSSNNEILAVRFAGINTRKIFVPIFLISLILSLSALLISDRLIPYTSENYQKEYSKVLSDLPTVEIESYKVNNINNLVLSNGEAHGSEISDLAIFDTRPKNNASAIVADKGQIKLINLDNYVYELTLDNPEVLTTFESQLKDYGLSKAEKMKLYLNFSNLIPSVQSLKPSQMSLAQLREKISEKEKDNDYILLGMSPGRSEEFQNLADSLQAIRTGSSLPDSVTEASLYELKKKASSYANMEEPNFYLQYYKSEFNKKLALSTACTFLVFLAFPISFFKVRYGRLIGFSLSLIASAAYWFALFFLQVKAVESVIEPALLMWLPNLVFLLAGLGLSWVQSRR